MEELESRHSCFAPLISRSWLWLTNWSNLATFFTYPTDIRKVLYMTNAIGSLNCVIRHAIKKTRLMVWYAL